VRQKEGDNPVKGGDMRFRPVNLTPLDPDDAARFAAAGLAPGTPSKGPSDGGDEKRDPENEQEQRESRAEQLAAAAAERIARKELNELAKCRGNSAVVALYEKHAAFVAEALGIELRAAAAYCAAQMQSLAAGRTPTFEEDTRARLAALALEPT
jgi:hypothetical protein